MGFAAGGGAGRREQVRSPLQEVQTGGFQTAAQAR